MWIPIIVALITVISTFYYIRIIQIIYFEEEKQNYGLASIYNTNITILYFIMILNISYMFVTNDMSSIMQYIAITLLA